MKRWHAPRLLVANVSFLEAIGGFTGFSTLDVGPGTWLFSSVHPSG